MWLEHELLYPTRVKGIKKELGQDMSTVFALSDLDAPGSTLGRVAHLSNVHLGI